MLLDRAVAYAAWCLCRGMWLYGGYPKKGHYTRDMKVKKHHWPAAEETGGDDRCHTPLQAALYGSERSSESFIRCMVLEWGGGLKISMYQWDSGKWGKPP